jgi:hypothetical protein
LNFLASPPPHAQRFAVTDSFGSDVYPRNEFVHTDRSKTLSIGCYCSRARLGAASQSAQKTAINDRASIPSKAQTLHWRPSPRRDGSQLIDQGRSLTCVHHEDV